MLKVRLPYLDTSNAYYSPNAVYRMRNGKGRHSLALILQRMLTLCYLYEFITTSNLQFYVQTIISIGRTEL